MVRPGGLVFGLVWVLCALELTGAGILPGPWTVFPDSKPSSHRLGGQASHAVAVRLFLDSTSSMKGFAGKQAPAFAADIQKLERAAHEMETDLAGTECFKFGAKAIPLSGPPCYGQVFKPSFFSLQTGEDKTRIESVVQEAREDALTVAVTDLFEDESDLDALFDVFRKHVFDRGLALGIVAMREPFDGTIYDIGVERGSRPWQHERPFYALVMGTPANVTSYLSALKALGEQESQLLVLSTDLIQIPISWANAKPVHSSNVAVDPSLVAVMPGQGTYGVLRLHNGDCALELELNAKGTPFRPAVDWAHVHPDPNVRRFVRNSGAAVNVDLGSDAVKASIRPEGKGDRLLLQLAWADVQIRPSDFTYVEDVRFVIGKDQISFANQPFVKDWSAVPIPGEATKFDGSKTQYLTELVNGLWQSAMRANPPDLGSVFIYFQP